jgi:FkbM family methyltransferase
MGLARSYRPKSLVGRNNRQLPSVLKFLVSHEVAANPDFTFLQIGAFDGAVNDDLRESIVRHRLRGVLVEPQPAAFARLTKTYADQPQVTLLNAAIADQPGTRTLYCPSVGDSTVASFDRQHLIRHGIRPDDIVGRAVSCHTVASALATSGLTRVDLLQTDAEGYDYHILRAVDFTQLQPTIVRFEYRHLSSQQVDELVEMLADGGYRFVTEERDIIAYRPRIEAAAVLAA